MSSDEFAYISETDFEIIWGAHYDSNDEFYAYEDLIGLEINKIWTCYEDGSIDENGCSDNNLYAMPGIVPAYAIGYLVATKAWRMDTPHAIWYLDDDEDAAEERRLDCLQYVL